MTRALVLFVGVLGAALPVWALSTYPVEDSFSRVLVAVILAGFVAGLAGLVLRARQLDRMQAQLGTFAGQSDAEGLRTSSPEAYRLVELRLRGERPHMARGEAMTHYLVSALVLVGLLGTFVGLVDALVGARDALGVSTDVGALRAALLAPMKGLSRAFGTSVAGISSSAMLGLAAVVVRRAEQRVLESVDAAVSGPLHEQTLVARQLAAFEKLGLLGENLPAAVERMADVATRLPTLEHSLVGGHEALAEALKASVEKAALDLRQGLERGLAAASEAHDELVERAVSKASSVLEERAAALAKVSEDRLAALVSLEEERAEVWREQLAERAKHDAAREQGLLVLLEKAAGVAEGAASSAGEHAAEMRSFLEEQKAGDRKLAEELRTSLTAQKEGDRGLLAALQAFLSEQRESERALAAEMRGLFEEQKGHDRAALERVQAFLEEQKAGDRALVEDMRAFLRDEKGQALAFSDDIRAQLETWLSTAAERDEAREAQRLALEEKLALERQALTGEVVTHLDAHATTVRAKVSDMARSLSDGADALVAGGIELTSLAERFSGAVDGYKEATREWMDRLATLEVGLQSGGADHERERFGAYLDQTREVFERSLELQRELFSGLKAAERLEPEDEGGAVPDDVVAAGEGQPSQATTSSAAEA